MISELHPTIKCIKCGSLVEMARVRIFGAHDPSGRTCAACAHKAQQTTLERIREKKAQAQKVPDHEDRKPRQLSFGNQMLEAFGIPATAAAVRRQRKWSPTVYVLRNGRWIPKSQDVGKPKINRIYDDEH